MSTEIVGVKPDKEGFSYDPKDWRPDPNRPLSILLCTPAYSGGLTVSYMTSVLKMERFFRAKGIPCEYYFIFNESLITRGRNALANTYIKLTNYTHMLFIDSDIEFEPEDVLEMLLAQKPICCGLYAKKNINWKKVHEYVMNTPKDQITEHALQGSGLSSTSIFLRPEDITSKERFVEVLYGATGIMLIDRHVFEAIQASAPNDTYVKGDGDDERIYRFFDTEVVNGNYLSEDYYFCHLWRKLGGAVWMMMGFRCRHYGFHAYG